ncbi:MAG: UDP-N-acetylmuramate--L-alanine ligase [Clostridiales bacterium]|jgi:UDP-N-acetylmuramate--alanine ligase|nr:UDP-N-acetylmuramate--L-alanine ligase [Clostridiales bacterium]
MKVSDFGDYMKYGKRGHLIGIGGVSMSALAEVLISMGLQITGSDSSDSDTVRALRNKGIRIQIGHYPESVSGAEFVIRTAAVHDDNPEIIAAKNAGIPVFERAQAWGAIMREYETAVCVSGTHGKTTTTSMITHIFMAAEKDPTIMIGGSLPMLKSGYRIGKGKTIVLESCEYCNSFHSFFPTIAVVLNVDEDHLDFFSGIQEIKASFRKFAGLVPENGWVIANRDDQNTMDALSGLDRKTLTFGMKNDADVQAADIKYERNPSFDIRYKGDLIAHITLNVPGEHNVLNALAAAAAAIVAGIPAFYIEQGLSAFTGAGRRLEYKGSVNGAEVYDDYAHHPFELQTLFKAVRQMDRKRLICAFQPHTYSRTKAMFKDFVETLGMADIVFLADIYSARETDTLGISSKDLADKIPGARFFDDFGKMAEAIKKIARPGDIILTVGAGNIYKVGESLLA